MSTNAAMAQIPKKYVDVYIRKINSIAFVEPSAIVSRQDGTLACPWFDAIAPHKRLSGDA